MELQEGLKSIQQAKLQIVAISYDSVETLAEFSKQHKIEFPLLSDEDSRTIDAYGVRNEDVRPNSRQDGIPHPGTFLVDRHGVIRAKLSYSVRKRHSPRELIEAAAKLREEKND